MVGTNETAAAAAAITAQGVVVAHKKTAPVTKPTVGKNGGHNGNGNGTKSTKRNGKKGTRKTATWSYGAPKNVVLQNSLYTSGYGSLTWQNLHEADCLASLPEPLRSLVHFKQLSREMSARTMLRATTAHSMEGHRQTVDLAYLTALQQYIVTLEEEEEETVTIDANANADETKNNANAAEEEEPEEKKDDDPDEPDPERNEDGAIKTQQEHARYATKTEQLFRRAETMAFLYRYASSLEEQQVLHDEYRKQTAKYIVQMLAGKTNTSTSTSTVSSTTSTAAAVAAEQLEDEEDGEEVEAEESEAPMTGEGEDEDDDGIEAMEVVGE